MKQGSKSRGGAARPTGATSARAQRRSTSSRPDAPSQLDKLERELKEAQEQQRATTAVLRLISSSPGQLDSVFKTLLTSAVNLCGARFGNLFLYDGDKFTIVAMHGAPAALSEWWRANPTIRPGPQTGLVRLVKTKRVNQTEDLKAGAAYAERDPLRVATVELAGARTLVDIPLLKDNVLIGAIVIYRQEVRLFTDKEIELLTSFAAQAVIAIENARLLSELKESLQQQTATADVLRIISSSPGDLQPVFSAMLESAASLCDASFGNIFRWDDDALRLVATYNTPVAFAEARSRLPLSRDQNNPIAEMLTANTVLHVDDLAADERYTNKRDPNITAAVELGGIRTFLAVPMLKDDELIGALIVYRQEVRPFSDKQIELVKNFAAQAVIAIENARLLNELKESLQQQTATADVLRIISSSPGELEPVFQAILQNAVRICEAEFGHMVLTDGDLFRLTAEADTPAELAERLRQRGSFEPTPGSHLDRVRRTKQVSHTADDATEAVQGLSAKYGGARSIIAVPMLKDDVLIGVILIYRQEVRPFTDKQIELVKNFAAQAVIAIENARLLNELRESLEQQTATSEVLRVISSSQGDLKPVFESLLANAVRLCEAKFGLLLLYEGNWHFRVVAMSNAPPAFAELRQREPVFDVTPETGLGRAIATKDIVHIADYAKETIYKDERHPAAVALGELGGARTFLVVPMLNDQAIVGVIAIYRQEVRPFADKQIELVKNFASQAVIAIENARLLNELRESLEQQTATSEVLKIIAGSPGKLEPVFSEMLESATLICEAKFGTLFLYDGNTFRVAAGVGTPPELAEFERLRGPFQPELGSRLERIVGTKQVIHIVDDAAEDVPSPPTKLAGARSIVAVPMLKDDVLIGAIAIFRQEVRAFTDKQIALLVNFAAQAVIAIENARLLNELRQRTVDLTESLERQTATSEVFQLISSPQASVPAVLDSVAANAVRLCEALNATIYLRDGEFVVIHAHSGPLGTTPLGTRQVPNNKWVTGRAVLEGRTIHVPDLQSDDDYPEGKEIALRLGHRTTLAVPLIRDETAIGAILLRRREARPFNDRQIALVQHFAAQAVIAIENARLLKELRERTEQLEVQSQEVIQLNQQLEARVADQVGEIERMGRLRRFLPPQVADLIVASGTDKQLESHRREITALFCDLRGFTGFSESSDPEDVMTLLRQYHAALGEIIIKYSGTLERYAGDGVMVVFNDPVPVDNPALQAVRMALDMRAALGALIEKWRRLGHELGFGIGIAHGYATLGTIGFEGRFDYAAIGTVSNVASRLCDEAKPGQILISPRVLMAVEDAVAVEPIGDFALKGISRPLAAYNVVGVK